MLKFCLTFLVGVVDSCLVQKPDIFLRVYNEVLDYVSVFQMLGFSEVCRDKKQLTNFFSPYHHVLLSLS